MKRILALTLCVLMLLLCSCQPTPDEEPVPNKGDDVMGEKIHTTPVPKTPDPNTPEPGTTDDSESTDVPFVIPTIDVPEHWSEEYEFDFGTKVVIDADIEYENVAHPVYLIRDTDYDPEKLMKLIIYFSKDPKWRPTDTTREELLERLKVILEGNVYIDENGNEVREPWPDEEEAKAEILRRLQELDPETHWEDINSPEDIPQGASVLSDGERSYGLQQFRRDLFRIRGYDQDLIPYNELMLLQTRSKLPEPTMEKEEAIRLAEEVIKDVEFDDHFRMASVKVFALVNIKTQKQVGHPGWSVSFTLRVDGARNLDHIYYNFEGMGITQNQLGDEASDYRPGVKDETLTLYFQDGILIGVLWTYPQELVSVENPAVELMPFDEIMERFKKRLKYGLYYREGKVGYTDVITVSEILLTYIKTNKANAPEEYYYSPMWTFVSDDTMFGLEMPQEATVINAIDGTFVHVKDID